MQRKFLKIRLQKGSNILQAAGNCRWKGQVSPCVAMECTFQGIGKNCLFKMQSIISEASKFKFALQNFY